MKLGNCFKAARKFVSFFVLSTSHYAAYRNNFPNNLWQQKYLRIIKSDITRVSPTSFFVRLVHRRCFSIQKKPPSHSTSTWMMSRWKKKLNEQNVPKTFFHAEKFKVDLRFVSILRLIIRLLGNRVSWIQWVSIDVFIFYDFLFRQKICLANWNVSQIEIASIDKGKTKEAFFVKWCKLIWIALTGDTQQER